jgi:hypothetical protein
MQHDAFRISGGARCVVKGDRIPFVFRIGPGKIGIARGKKAFVVDLAERLARRAERIIDIDHEQLLAELSERRRDDAREFAVGDQHLRLAMFQDEGNGLGVEPRVERIQHRADHRHAEMRLEQMRRVRRHHRDGVVLADAAALERAGKPAAARVGLGPATTLCTMDHGELVGMHRGGALDEAERRQRNVIGRIAIEVDGVWVRHGFPPLGLVAWQAPRFATRY